MQTGIHLRLDREDSRHQLQVEFSIDLDRITKTNRQKTHRSNYTKIRREVIHKRKIKSRAIYSINILVFF
jgi:hypothetical protein